MAHFLRRGAAALPQVTQPRLRCLGTVALRASRVPLTRTALGRSHGLPVGPQTGSWATYQGLRGMAVVEQAIDDFGAESITEGTVQEWKKKVGDVVSKGELIAVIETDKVTVDVNAKEAGTIEEILIKADENVLKGQPLVRIAAGAGAGPSAPAPETPAATPAAKPAAAPAADGPARVLEIAVQDFGAESITEGTLMEWRKEVGAFVEKGELLAVIETDKVTVDVKAEEAGTLTEILVKADGTVSKGQPLAKLTAGGGGGGTAPAAAATAPAASAPPAASGPAREVEIVVKDFGAESITEGTLMEWRKEVGQFADKGEILAVIETDKVSIEVKAEEAGTLTEIFVKADGTVEAGQAVAKMSAGGAAPAAAATAAPSPTAAVAPAAAAAAAASGEPLTGLRAAFARLAALRLGLPWPPAPAASAAPAKSPAPKVPVPKAPVSGGAGRSERRVPISPMRQRVVQRIKDTQNTAALLTTFQEADMSAALGIRSKYHEAFQKKHGVAFGLLSLFAKASASALQEVPGVNAVIDDAAKETVYRENANISVPIPTPRGPISCVLPGVKDMSILDIECAIQDLRSRALKDELAVDDMLGATFGIVDSGVAGGMMGTGMINPPQSAVLGTNAVTNRVVVVDGKVVARPVMYLSLTYDHRLIDGREAVTFLCAVRDKMEDPSRLMLDL